MSHKYHKVSKFGNQHCYYSHATGQIFNEVALSTFSEEAKESFGLLEKFDSLLEARVYAALKYFEAEVNASKINVKAVIVRQFSIEVKPETEMFDPIIYKADFQLNLIDGTKRIAPLCAFIEAKGVETPEYRLKMKFLEYYDPMKFHAIVQVTDKQKPNSVVSSMTLKELPKFLIKMIQMYFNLRTTSGETLGSFEDMTVNVVARIVSSRFN